MEKEHDYYVYIMASKRNGTLYIGVTNDIIRRTGEHKAGLMKGFTEENHVHMLVYYECYGDILEAIWREKCLKRWNRSWKLKLIESKNPKWRDLPLDWVMDDASGV